MTDKAHAESVAIGHQRSVYLQINIYLQIFERKRNTLEQVG